jgi:hypothetical protein
MASAVDFLRARSRVAGLVEPVEGILSVRAEYIRTHKIMLATDYFACGKGRGALK